MEGGREEGNSLSHMVAEERVVRGWDITYPTVFITMLKWYFMLTQLPSLETRNDHLR